MRIRRTPVSHDKKIKFDSSLQRLVELRCPSVSSQAIRNFIKLAEFANSQPLKSTFASTVTKLADQIRSLQSSRRCKIYSAALNVNGCRPSRHSIFNVFKCFLSAGAVTALSAPFRFSMRISPESTRSCNQSIGQCRCRIRPAPRLSVILLAELLSVQRTHCATFSPKSIIMLLAPTRIDAPVTLT